MNEELKPFIDESKFKKLLEEFRKEGWTKKGRIYYNKFEKYIESVEGIIYDTNYLNLDSFDLETTVYSSSIYNVPSSRRGHLKRYRNYKVLIMVLGCHQYKRTIGCFPLNKIND